MMKKMVGYRADIMKGQIPSALTFIGEKELINAQWR
jgi:hypothetical protein